MEQDGKLIANSTTTNQELKKKDCDSPTEPVGHNVLGVPAFCVTVGNGWPESSNHVHTHTVDGDSSSRCSELPCNSPYSLHDPTLVVEELTVRNYKIPNLPLVSNSNLKEGMNSIPGQWQHLQQWVGGLQGKDPFGDFASWDKDPILRSAREDLRRIPIGNRDLSLGKKNNQDSEDLSTHLIDRYNKTTSSKMEPFVDNKRSKVISQSSFSQYFAKRNLKGKGVLSKSHETNGEFTIDKQIGKVDFDASVNSIAKIDPPSKNRIQEGGFESFNDGINLREWLKSKSHEINKDESLRLFTQIVELVDFVHSQGVLLRDIRPSSFILFPSNTVNYIGSSIQNVVYNGINGKRPLEHEIEAYGNMGVKHQKLDENTKSLNHRPEFNSRKDQKNFNCSSTSMPIQEQLNYVDVELEKKWYASPEGPNEGGYLSSNIYSVGVLLFELLCRFESLEVHLAAMVDLRRRVLPPHFLSENPMETGFCLWLLHPEPTCRPTTREILQSELICGSQVSDTVNDLPSPPNEDDTESELLLHFLLSLKEQKQKDASEVEECIKFLEMDIKEIEGRHVIKTTSSDIYPSVLSQSLPFSNAVFSQLENAYFSVRCQTQTSDVFEERSDRDFLRNRERRTRGVHTENEVRNKREKSMNRVEAFFEGLCKFSCYSKFEVCGGLRKNDLLNSSNVICSLSLDRDEDYIASAGVSKKIKVFEFDSLLNDEVDIHYPVAEMLNKSKLSCVCWNKYIKNYLASTDYEGVVQMWDATTGQGFSQHVEHRKRAWSVDFSQVDPMKFASGSDDCSVKLWNINEKTSIGTIGSPANVCCVQFSPYSSNLLAFGSADYKIYCYDLRNTRIPWCTLAGHGKAVSFIKFIDSENIVSASTDNTLKLWDLNKTSSERSTSNACSLTFRGHTNEKNFVGLSVSNGYIVCGSETNEVYAYYKSLPIPFTSHKFGSIDPISGHEIEESNGQFVSSVCWRGKSNMVVAANSSGSMKLLRMV